MHSDILALAAMLDEAVVLLRRHRLDHWADWLLKDAMSIRNLDFHGVEHLLSAFGGMGSLNDIGLAEQNPNNPSVLIASPDDAHFQALLSEIHILATKLAREEPRATRCT